MPLLMRLAWRNLWRNRRRTLITVSAMAFGLAVCMAMVAILDGFYTEIFRSLVTESVGHIQIHQRDFPAQRAVYHTIGGSAALQARIEACPGVARVAVRVYGAALLGAATTSAGALVTGIDPEREAALTRIDRKIVSGRSLSPQPQGEIIVGHKLARRLKIDVGSELVAVTQAADGSLGNELYQVVGLFRTNNVAQDSAGAFVHVADAQTLLGLNDQVHELALVTAPNADIGAMVATVTGLVAERPLLVRPWYAVHLQLQQLLRLGDASMFILLAILFVVAGIGVLNTMLMSVFERTKELGVVSALGLRPWQLIILVLAETLALALVATLVGVPLGLGLDGFLIWHGLDLRWFSANISMLGTTFDPIMRGEFRIGRIVEIEAGLVAISLLAAIWPALRAARLRPAVAMRVD